MHRLSVSFWFFFLCAGRLWLPVRGFSGLVLAGALGLLFWHRVKLCILHGRFPADIPPRKNHEPSLYLPSLKPLKPFRPFVCGVRAGAECHGRPHWKCRCLQFSRGRSTSTNGLIKMWYRAFHQKKRLNSTSLICSLTFSDLREKENSARLSFHQSFCTL